MPLGTWPTAIDTLAGVTDRAGGSVFVKREDRSAATYGGNKVRPLELMFGEAQHAAASRIWSLGAYGSNHALAAALHAPRAGLAPAALLWPQPTSGCARDNLAALLSVPGEVRLLRTIVQLPWSVGLLAGLARFGRQDYVMAPGAAVPEGAFAYLSAGLELAFQVAAGEAPEPHHIVVGVGSTCTTAGLLVGLALAHHLGIAFPDAPPHVHAVRVTPWPVTAASRILGLAERTSALLCARGGPDLGLRAASLAPHLSVTGEYLGAGYGRPTTDGRAALARFEAAGSAPLDTTYSAKAGAAVIDIARDSDGPVLFWATKSSAPLPCVDPAVIGGQPARIRGWLAGV